MAIQKKDYYTFLGGEVSPNLFKRVDMRAANKWFETAKNIFFDTTGGFFNRVGTEIIDNTYQSGYKIKLLKFIYNKEQTYEVIFSQTNIKIYDNKTLLQTVQHNLSIPTDFDIIYTQIGDVMYVCFGSTTKIYTLTRYANNDWKFEEFRYSIPPMGEINLDKSKTLTFVKNISYSNLNYVSFNINQYSQLNNVSVSYKDTLNVYHTLFTGSSSYTISEFVSAFNAATGTNLNFEAIKINNDEIRINIPQEYSGSVSKIRIVSDGIVQQMQITENIPSNLTSQGLDDYYYYPHDNFASYNKEQTFSLAQNVLISSAKFKRVNPSDRCKRFSVQYNKEYLSPINITTFVSDVFSEYGGLYEILNQNKQPVEYNGISFFNNMLAINGGRSFNGAFGGLNVKGGGLFLEELNYYNVLNNGYIIENDVTSTEISDDNIYTVSSNFDMFGDKYAGNIFAIESLFSPSFEGTSGENLVVNETNLSAGTGYLPVEEGFWSNGSWRLVTSGLFTGTIELQYSYDGTNWYSHRTFTSTIKTESGISTSTNYNEYGTLEVDDNVKLRLKYDISSATNLGITFDTDSFENRSYYKILSKASSTQVIAECIKYSIGTPASTYQWAEPAWSDAEGYPAICFTYQNRLCFAKTNNNPFVVWTSKTNDYSAFDTKIKYQDDDPITMDVVKFNGVSNIATIAALNKLFVFTEDAEFGIQDQGALTQANKSLISFSKYGAEPIETQVSGNRILFVENGGKAARQLFYDFAQENYEAPDVTVLYKHLLKDEKIIATDYVGLDYRMYLMLTNTGRVICYKYIPEQEVTACSWFKHAKGTITNISALDVGNNTVRIYMAVDIGSRKQLEVMDLTNENYLDSRHTFTTDTATTTIDTTGYFDNGDEVCYFLNGIKHTATIENNTLTLEEEIPADTEIEVGYPYEAEATLIPMSAIARNGSFNYNRKNIFKANFEYFDSVAFKVGMKSYQEEFEEIKYEDGPVGTENTPHSGEKTDIIILSSYLDKNMLSFKQTEPYKMNVTNLEVEVDYGN